VGDCDFVQDPVAVQVMANPFSGQRMVAPQNGNLGLAQSAIEQLTGDNNLIAVEQASDQDLKELGSLNLADRKRASGDVAHDETSAATNADQS